MKKKVKAKEPKKRVEKKAEPVKDEPKQESSSGLMKKIRPPKRAAMLELVPIKGTVEGRNFFELTDHTYMDIVRICTRDLMAISDDEFNYYVSVWTNMYRKMGFDIKLVSLNAPTDTRLQQKYVKHKMESNPNPAFTRFLSEKLTQLENIQAYRTDRQFYMMVFADSVEDYRDDTRVPRRKSGGEFPFKFILF